MELMIAYRLLTIVLLFCAVVRINSFHHISDRLCSATRAPVVCHSVESDNRFSQHAERDVIVERLAQLGAGKVQAIYEVSAGPGIQNRHYRYDTTEGSFFCKISSSPALNIFEAEVAGLSALKSCGGLRVPEPLSYGPLDTKGSYLLMEYMPFIPFGQSIPEVVEDLAMSLAKMHLSVPPASLSLLEETDTLYGIPANVTRTKRYDIPKGNYGFPCDGRLGSAPQPNAWLSNYADFFLERRLMPQFVRAANKFSDDYGTSNEDSNAFFFLENKLFEAARQALEPVKNINPCLLHGDLWIGNWGAVNIDRRRTPVVFDPACWFGHHEFDLAIASLFGGFSEAFQRVYFSIIPKSDGFEKRMKLYKLYHLLNHLNLHGAGFSSKGSSEDPDGYFERVIKLMRDIVR